MDVSVSPAWTTQHWLALNRAPLACQPRLRILLDHRDTPEALFTVGITAPPPPGCEPHAMSYFRSPDWRGVECDLHWLERPDSHLVNYFDPAYPALLRELADPPVALFVRGDPAVLASIQVAIVGTRKPSADGRRFGFELARALAARGIVIASGLALGIDTQAHRGALADLGRTVAVLGNGLRRIYPQSNNELAELIAERGALISEFPTDYVPLPDHFPRRNRLISGLSVGTVVVEAALRSGSLITARHALEQGREVFAVPGSVFNPVAKGCHELIRQGAVLVKEADDIIAEIGALSAFALAKASSATGDPSPAALDEVGKLLLDNIGYSTVTVDMLVTVTGMPTEKVIATLCSLEVAEAIVATAGGGYVRRP